MNKEPLSNEELNLFGSLFFRRIANLSGSGKIDRRFLALINKRLWQLTGLVQDKAPEDMLEFQFVQFVAMVAKEAQRLYGKPLKYDGDTIEVDNEQEYKG